MKKLPLDLAPLAEPLESACQLLERCGHPGMLIGGVAVALRARPRQTADVDLVLWCPDTQAVHELAAVASTLGLEPRLKDAVAFAQEARVLLLRHGPTQVALDIALAQLEYEQQAIARSSRIRVGSLAIPTATVEDLIIMKAVAGRPQDWLDIRMLLEAHPRLNRRHILHWLGEFAQALDSPDLVTELTQLLSPQKRSRKKRGP
jgi:hypothetical protein